MHSNKKLSDKKRRSEIYAQSTIVRNINRIDVFSKNAVITKIASDVRR